jgi:hypothetical protein
MKATVVKKSKKPFRVVGRRVVSGKPSFANWAKKYAGVVNTGIGNLSTREGLGD